MYFLDKTGSHGSAFFGFFGSVFYVAVLQKPENNSFGFLEVNCGKKPRKKTQYLRTLGNAKWKYKNPKKTIF